MKKISLVFVFIGLLFFTYSITLESYSNLEEYNEKYYSLEGEDKYEKFIELREEYLTPKYKIQDYSLTLFVLGISLFFIYRNNSNLRIPQTKTNIGLIGFTAFVLTIFSLFGRLFLDSSRGEYPHFSDSYGIVFIAYFWMSILLLIWYLLNLFGLLGDLNHENTVKNINLKNISYWYTLISFLTCIVLVFLIIEGSFFMTLSFIFWLIFYLSILIARIKK